MPKVTIVNSNPQALDVIKYRQYANLVVPGSGGSVEIDVDAVEFYSEADQATYYTETYGTLPGVTCSYAPTGSVSLLVVEAATGTPVTGAVVTCSTQVTTPITTIADGAAEFEAVAVGVNKFTVAKDNFVTYEITINVAKGSSSFIQAALIAE